MAHHYSVKFHTQTGQATSSKKELGKVYLVSDHPTSRSIKPRFNPRTPPYIAMTIHRGYCTDTSPKRQNCWAPAILGNSLPGRIGVCEQNRIAFRACSVANHLDHGSIDRTFVGRHLSGGAKQLRPNHLHPPSAIRRPFNSLLLPLVSFVVACLPTKEKEKGALTKFAPS